MPAVNFDDAVEKIVAENPRYNSQAYVFIHMALGHTQRKLAQDGSEKPHHITGQELLDGIRNYASIHLGSSAKATLESWGIHSCRDFGEIIFLMVEFGLVLKTEQDSLADFETGYDFATAFPEPFYSNPWFRVCCAFAMLLLLIVLFLSR